MASMGFIIKNSKNFSVKDLASKRSELVAKKNELEFIKTKDIILQETSKNKTAEINSKYDRAINSYFGQEGKDEEINAIRQEKEQALEAHAKEYSMKFEQLEKMEESLFDEIRLLESEVEKAEKAQE